MKTRFLLLIIIVLVSFGCNNDENIMKNQNIEGSIWDSLKETDKVLKYN